MTNLDELRSEVEEEWEAFPQKTIDHAINSFKPRLKRVIEENGGHIKNIMIDLSFTINLHHFDI